MNVELALSIAAGILFAFFALLFLGLLVWVSVVLWTLFSVWRDTRAFDRARRADFER